MSSLPNSLVAPQVSSKSPFSNGRDLKVGVYYRNIASSDGEVQDSDTYFQVTDQVDKKGNRLLVAGLGATVWASPTSLWSV